MLIDFEEIKHKLNSSKWYGTQAWYEILNIIGDCDDKSRPKGKWIKESDYKVMGDGYMWNCSECGNRVYVDSRDDFPNYCDKCGADMRGEE